jgi:hypothetical protein
MSKGKYVVKRVYVPLGVVVGSSKEQYLCTKCHGTRKFVQYVPIRGNEDTWMQSGVHLYTKGLLGACQVHMFRLALRYLYLAWIATQ